MIFIASSVDSVVGTSHPIINSIAANAACLWCVIPTVRAVSSIIVSVCASRVVGDLFSPLRLNLRLCETALRIVCLSSPRCPDSTRWFRGGSFSDISAPLFCFVVFRIRSARRRGLVVAVLFTFIVVVCVVIYTLPVIARCGLSCRFVGT